MASKSAGAALDLNTLFGNDLIAKKAGQVVPAELSSLDGKFVGIYFSAHWCPPCRSFTPLLKKMYLTLMALGKPFEVIFVSSDQSQGEFDEYYSEMPWMAVPYKEPLRRNSISRRFGVAGIPCLVILNPEGQIVNSNARSAVVRDPAGDKFPWAGEEERPPTNLLPVFLMIVVAWFIAQWLFGNKR